MTPVRGRGWKLRVLVLFSVSLGVLALTCGVWAAPSQQPVRQTVPTRTPSKRPTQTPTHTLVPTATHTATPTTQLTIEPTTVVSPEPTAGPTESAPTEPDPASSPTPLPAGEDVQLPTAGADWSAALQRSVSIVLGGLALALGLGALTFARRSPKDDRAE